MGDRVKTMNLGDVLENLSEFFWKECVYIQEIGSPSVSTPCLVIDDNEAEPGSDGFTPLEAEKRGMVEFLSIHDLQGVLKYLAHYQPDASVETKCAAAAYYFEYDAFMPPSTSV